MHPGGVYHGFVDTLDVVLRLVLAVVFTVLGIRHTGRLTRPHGFIEDEPAVAEATGD